MLKLLAAVKYMHEKQIVHKDLKPHNILLTSNKDDTDYKIIDFGLAEYCEGSEKLTQVAGTPIYVAPEVMKGKYGKE